MIYSCVRLKFVIDIVAIVYTKVWHKMKVKYFIKLLNKLCYSQVNLVLTAFQLIVIHVDFGNRQFKIKLLYKFVFQVILVGVEVTLINVLDCDKTGEVHYEVELIIFVTCGNHHGDFYSKFCDELHQTDC